MYIYIYIYISELVCSRGTADITYLSETELASPNTDTSEDVPATSAEVDAMGRGTDLCVAAEVVELCVFAIDCRVAEA